MKKERLKEIISEEVLNMVEVSMTRKFRKAVEELQKVLNTKNVACVIDAKHLCVNSRGIRDIESSTVTSEFGGEFKNINIKREFLDYIKLDTKF